MAHLLYKREGAWGLPSLSPGCIQAEAMLRFASVEFSVAVQDEPNCSPTGWHPAVERDLKLAATEKCLTEFDCVRQIEAFLKSKGTDVDAHLAPSQRLVAKAIKELLQQRLEPATLFTAWCENEGFKHYKDAYGGKLPFPLNFVVAKTEQRRIQKLLSSSTPEEIYAAAGETIEALSPYLETGEGYLLGSIPSSADAYLYGHLLFYKLSPVVSPELQRKVNASQKIKVYLDKISKDSFKDLVPVLGPADAAVDAEGEEMTSAWSTAPKNAAVWSAQKLWEELQKMDTMSKWWLGSATALLCIYSWLRPPFVVLTDMAESFVEDEDETE